MRKILLIAVIGLLLADSAAFARGSVGRAAYAAHTSKDNDFKIIALAIIVLAIVVRILCGIAWVIGGVVSLVKPSANPYSDDRDVDPDDRFDRSATDANQEPLSLDDDPPSARDNDPRWDEFVREVECRQQRR